jgi:hypothetical protein
VCIDAGKSPEDTGSEDSSDEKVPKLDARRGKRMKRLREQKQKERDRRRKEREQDFNKEKLRAERERAPEIAKNQKARGLTPYEHLHHTH